jgi:hypothetical protein
MDGPIAAPSEGKAANPVDVLPVSSGKTRRRNLFLENLPHWQLEI